MVKDASHVVVARGKTINGVDEKIVVKNFCKRVEVLKIRKSFNPGAISGDIEVTHVDIVESGIKLDGPCVFVVPK